MKINEIIRYTKNLNVLYVEDEENILINTKDIFEDIFASVSTAKDGLEGLLQYKAHHPKYFDIVITDIKMPRKDGISMIEDIIQINEEQSIIAVSSYNDSNILMQLIQVGISNFIMKPFTPDSLIKTLYKTSKAIHDYREKINLENELTIIKNKRAVLDGKMIAIRKMIQDIGHQWRQPLSAITMSASAIKLEKENNLLTDNILFQRCNTINSSAEYLSKIIENFSTYFKDDKFMVNFNITDSLTKVIDKAQNILNENQIKIIKNYDYSINVEGSVKNFTQAVYNLIENAIDALIDKVTSEKLIFIDLYKSENKVILTIKDNAKGIPEDLISDIFNIYVTTKHKYIGTGLGLYNVYNTIKTDMNGDIDVSNTSFHYKEKQYSGAQFTIILPIQEL